MCKFSKNIVNKLVNKPLKYKVDQRNLCDYVIIAQKFGKTLNITMDHSKDISTCIVCCYLTIESQMEF